MRYSAVEKMILKIHFNIRPYSLREKWLLPPCSSSLDIPNYWRLRLMGAAAYAIESRMTTHLGKPKDTLNVSWAERMGYD